MTTLDEKLQYQFVDSNLLIQALTHKSYFNECTDKSLGYNEKLEFLGDAVIDLSLSHKLFVDFPNLEEGHLSKLRASLVNEGALAQLAVEMGMDQALLLGKGEEHSGGREKPRLLACVFEAIVGAIYLDGGFLKVHDFILRVFGPLLDQVDITGYYHEDYKTNLQEITQTLFKVVPEYKLLRSDGPDHHKIFQVEVIIDGKALATGEGRSKKQAEQQAAKLALEKLI